MADYTINYDEIAEWLKLYKAADNEKDKYHLQNVIALAAMPLVKKISRGLRKPLGGSSIRFPGFSQRHPPNSDGTFGTPIRR